MKTISTPNGEYPIRYGWGALSDFADQTENTLDEILSAFEPSKLKPREFSYFVFYGIKDGCEESGKEFPFKSIKEIEKIINETGLRKVIRASIDAFQESPFVINSKEEKVSEEDKKK
jgi:hypothetical protein